MFRNRYVSCIWALVMAMLLFRGASRGSHQDSLFSVNIADVILLMASGAFVGLGVLALFGKFKRTPPDR